MPATLTVIGVVAVAVLVWFFMRERTQDHIGEKLAKRRTGAQVLARGEYVEGMQHIPVAMVLSNGVLYYENDDFEASLEMERIDEVEYTHELSTGKEVAGPCGVLRLRSHGTAFDFVLKNADCEEWKRVLPPRMAGATVARAS